MRSVRPSLSIALFVGSAAALACGGGDDDDKMMQSTFDAAVVATGGAGASPGGAGPADAGLPSNPLAGFDASGIINGLRDSGILTTSPDGGVGFNSSAVCNLAPALCQDGSFSLPSGDGGTSPIGGLAGLAGGLGGGATGAGGATGGINIGQICQTMPQICAAFAGGGTAGTGP